MDTSGTFMRAFYTAVDYEMQNRKNVIYFADLGASDAFN